MQSLRYWGVVALNRGNCAVRHVRSMSMAGGALAIAGFATVGLAQQTPQQIAINELKTKIFDAKMVEKSFAGGLKHCKELDGKHFYLETRNRVLNLEEFHRALQNLVRDQVFNPDKRRPWNAQDAKDRWEQVQRIAAQDQTRCALVANLPAMQKELEEREKKRN